MTNENIQQTRVVRLTVGRVHNLGNYENMRYEIVVDVAPGDDPSKILCTLEALLNDLHLTRHISEWDLQRARQALGKPESELDEYEKKKLDHYRQFIARYEKARATELRARAAVSTLAYSSEYRDAKDKWEDDGF